MYGNRTLYRRIPVCETYICVYQCSELCKCSLTLVVALEVVIYQSYQAVKQHGGSLIQWAAGGCCKSVADVCIKHAEQGYASYKFKFVVGNDTAECFVP